MSYSDLFETREDRYTVYVKGVTESTRDACFIVIVQWRGAQCRDHVSIGNRGRAHALQAANLMAVEFHLLLGKPLTRVIQRAVVKSNTGIMGVHRRKKNGGLEVYAPGDTVKQPMRRIMLPATTSDAVAELVREVMYQEAMARRPIQAAQGAGRPELW